MANGSGYFNDSVTVPKTEMLVLWAVARHWPNECTNSLLFDTLAGSVSKASLFTLVSRLENRGLIKRRRTSTRVHGLVVDVLLVSTSESIATFFKDPHHESQMVLHFNRRKSSQESA